MATAVDCWDDLMTRVKRVPEFAEKCASVLSGNDLKAILKGAKPPMAGVVFGGITANAGDPSRQGMSADFTCAILVVVQGNAIGFLDQKNEAVRLLQAIRDQIKLSVSPTGHKWRFVRENVIASEGNVIIYSQQWSTAIMLT